MSMDRRPIKIYGHGGPDQHKIEIYLKELSLSYVIEELSETDIKKADHVAINPSGRFPGIFDPNTSFAVFESGAIMEYLVSNYDKDHRIIFRRGTMEFWNAKQWLVFQTTVQGPLYAQLDYFKKLNDEKLRTATEYYIAEINRIAEVLETRLTTQEYQHPGGSGPWLVGSKLSFVDLAYPSWQRMIAAVVSKEEYDLDRYPHVKAWLEKINARPSVKETFDVV